MNPKYITKFSTETRVAKEVIHRLSLKATMHDVLKGDIVRNLAEAIYTTKDAVQFNIAEDYTRYAVDYRATIWLTTPTKFQDAVEEEVARRLVQFEAKVEAEVQTRLKQAIDREIKLRRAGAEFVMAHGYAPPTNISNPKDDH